MKLKRIVVTNDDGIDAPGLAVAERLAAELAEEVWVFAPATDQSGMAQALSMHHPLRVGEHGARRYSVTGTPADCVMVALGTELMDGARPDLVLSGVNWGHNLSDSVMYSGTVGAAVAAAHFNLPAIALSQAFTDRAAFDFAVTETWARAAVEALWAAREAHGCVWNVNFPTGDPARIQGLRFTRQVGGSMASPRLVEQQDSRGQSYRWIAFERGLEAVDHAHSDAVALREGYVSAMPLKRERCDEARLEAVGVGHEWPLGDTPATARGAG
ncbi:5'/3'-nucleotidase SurE [Salinisphaera hydrothermalis]|uniref:5'-nucleotidase SurE n=1 Tax=Salinisphaera hydrothermalis (strain C41B8) TaxID=1304275 RepID=A0A084IN59_SALHC|nr:5'/3'-nucleotidase SurE [Salinisphaera hydrothermalis]KEZ78143.1 5'-nucleotidase surE 1 [Salinisphaera hydrothermalis C41B8]